MAGEIQVRGAVSRTVYALVRNATGLIWNTSTSAFQTYATGSYADFVISLTEQGTASGFYTGTFPAAIAAGVYSVVALYQSGASPAEGDQTVGTGDLQWSGSVTLPLSNLTTSGQLSKFMPVRLARAEMVENIPIYFKSAADHITPFTSGVVSGQISRDGGAFGALQSGAFTEVGLGWFSLQALTSGDLNAKTVAVLFTAVGISGGSADAVPLSLILQRSSGQ